MMGFGASGKELARKWEITDDGSETIDGTKTEKLELVARDPPFPQYRQSRRCGWIWIPA